MIFSHIYHIAKKNISNPAASLDAPQCSGFYILAFIAENELQPVYAPDDKQINNNHLWRWAHKLLHTSAVDQRESKTPIAFPIDFSANDFPFSETR